MPTLHTACPGCQQGAGRFPTFGVQRGWCYVRCPACGLVFLNPQPTQHELATFYNNSYAYDKKTYQRSVQQQSCWLELLERFSKRPGRLLEIGCSWGYFLAAARCRGWEVKGIELQESAADFARNELGLPVIAGTLSDARPQLSPIYDAIVAWHLLEHVLDPRKFLDEVFGLLLPGAVLALRVPNLDSAVARLAGRRWQWLSPPEHTYMFSARTLSHLLARSGFNILLTQTARGNARNIWFEVLRARTKQFVTRKLKRRQETDEPGSFVPPPVFQNRLWYRAAERAVELGSKPLDWLLSPWLARHGREAELVVVAQRPMSEVSAAF